MNDIKILIGSTKEEIDKRANFYQMFAQSPIPEKEILSNLGLYLNRQTLSRILFMHELYLKIVNVHGVVVEFGVRYGQNLALFESFRGIYEPFNYNRKVIGFDTFSGFPEVTLSKGDYSVPDNYENYLEDVLKYHESEQPIPQKKKFELVKGDAVITIDDYLERHPETIIALAYFDFDLYSPTKKCLQAIKDRLTKGSILAFDELNCPEFPGETLAFKEVIGINSYSIKRSPLNPLCSYIVIE